MKELIKNIFSNNPILRKNKFYYYVQRYRQYKQYKIDYSKTTHPEILDILQEDGIYIIGNFIDKVTCDKIKDELSCDVNDAMQFNYKNWRKDSGHYLYQKSKKGYQRASDNSCRILNVDKLSVTAKSHFFSNSLIKEIAQAYISKKAHCYRKELDYKVEQKEDIDLRADNPHFDDWRHRFKAFLYLTDVSEDNAPFVYYKGSHEQVDWKKPHHLEFELKKTEGRYGHFNQKEFDKTAEANGYEELICTGKAGTLILADFRGIHKGTPIKSGKRILLNSTWGI